MLDDKERQCRLTVADVSILQLSEVGDAVTDHLVDGCAAGLGEVEVVEGRRVAVPLHTRLVHHPVNLVRGHPRPHCPGTQIQHLSAQLQTVNHQ